MEPTKARNELIAEPLRIAAVQLKAAQKYIKKFDPENKENNTAALWLTMKVNELWLEYLETGEK